MTIHNGSHEDIIRIEPLWREFYREQKEMGMVTNIPVDAFNFWSSTMNSTLGRFSALFFAQEGEEISGFAAVKMRTMPPHLSGLTVGYISEVFVRQAFRGQGIGKKLVIAAMDWCHGNGIKRMELQVLPQNNSAVKLYQDLGWKQEYIQMVRIV